MKTLSTLYGFIYAIPTFFLLWFESVGLLQSHQVIDGTSFWCEIFNRTPWYYEIAIFLLIPFLAGIIVGLIIYTLFHFIWEVVIK